MTALQRRGRPAFAMSPSEHGGTPVSISHKRNSLFRAVLAGPVTALATLLTVMGLSAALPPGPAGIDPITLPIVALPLVWAALFFYAWLDPSLRRAALVVATLCAASAVMVMFRHYGNSAP